jgi:hypothetical protein
VRAAWLVIVALACGDKGDPHALTLFDKAEVAASLDDLMQRIDANRTRVCPAPHVRDPATPGASTEPLAEFITDPDIAACVAKLAELTPDAFAGDNPAVAAVDARCGAAIAAKLATLASYTNGCSPFQIGLRAETDESLRVLRIAKLAAFHARHLEPGAGVQASFNALRVFQDEMRGHVDL